MYHNHDKKSRSNSNNSLNRNDYINEIVNENKENSINSPLHKTKEDDLRHQHQESILYDIHDKDLLNPFGKLWTDSINETKSKSTFSNFKTYKIKSFIAKSNDDLRQELMVIQLIKRFDEIFREAGVPLKLKPYEILITSSTSGLVEFLPDTISIDYLKKNMPQEWDLSVFYRAFYKNNFEEAQKNFCESLAAYCLLCYLLEIRDRHNGNILLDVNGHIIHIDFGFILGQCPGGLKFEDCPFKLTTVRFFK